MPLLDSYLISVVFFVAAGLMFLRKQWEHAITRGFLALVYLFIPTLDMDIELARLSSRYFVFLLGLIEILSSLFRRLWKRYGNH